MKKTFEWTMGNGALGLIEATYAEVMEQKEINLDGHVVKGKAEPTTVGRCNMVVYINGKEFDSCRDSNFWRLIDVKPGTKKIWGLKIGFDAANAKRYEEFVSRLIDEGTTEEVKVYTAAKKTERLAQQIEWAEEVISKAEAQQNIPCAAEAKAQMKSYNDIQNEGGEGYAPRIYNKDEYNEALEIIAGYRRQ
ncbi:MAG: hypothetical protein WCS30_13425 [Selenomonadaceae bacterium]